MSRVRREHEANFEIPPGLPEVLYLESYKELENQLRYEVHFLGDVTCHPYLKSKISLTRVSLEKVYPCALYVVKSQLEVIRTLQHSLVQMGLDPLHLTSDLAVIHFQWGGKRRKLFPPVVEVSSDDGGKAVLIDGLHRSFIARQIGQNYITAVVIEDTAAPIPSLPVDWEKVTLTDKVPSNEEKRVPRFKGHLETYLWIVNNWKRFSQGIGETLPHYRFFRTLP